MWWRCSPTVWFGTQIKEEGLNITIFPKLLTGALQTTTKITSCAFDASNASNIQGNRVEEDTIHHTTRKIKHISSGMLGEEKI